MGTPFGLCAPLPISGGAHARRVEGGQGDELPRPIWYHVVVVFSPRPHPHVPSPGGCVTRFLVCLSFPFWTRSPAMDPSLRMPDYGGYSLQDISFREMEHISLPSAKACCSSHQPTDVTGHVMSDFIISRSPGFCSYPLSSIDTKPALASMF
ncbi:hypothetical protein CEXT_124181 [Caerostris extrusa]|uniref:Uncharacterized protein n=1 Tax=Caerostris extrusa TaxID=172846 RepID=A0AAV4MJ52_CAEEX|nr:hypothetical protein CEXT_124181 [Caerostris extrusa]